jgi:DAK2 domain fusion protein YloV
VGSLDEAALAEWCAVGLEGLRRHRQEIDDLNVYPVPDSDTGTNLLLTFAAAGEAAADGVAGSDQTDGDPATPLGRTLRRMARGALVGARGNSGVILSQLLAGIAQTLADVPVVRGRELSKALCTAAEAAYAAVGEPVEGTVLTVARAAATAARELGSDDLGVVCTTAARAAAQALARTPEQLDVLKRAGVVDAGGRGLVVLLDALASVVTGSRTDTVPHAGRTAGTVVQRETGSTAYAYEVQYLLDAPDVTALRAELGALGDSLVVVGSGDGLWNVHVHANDVGAAIEAGIRAGRPHRISVTRFEDDTTRPATGKRGVVVATESGILAELFTAEGAVVVDGGGSAALVLAAVRATGAAEVVVLPRDADGQAACAAAAEEARGDGVRVAVVPARSPMQAVAALAVRDATRRFDDDVIAMAEAAGATRCAEVIVATRDALTSAGRCHRGDVLALVEGEVVMVTPGPAAGALVPAAQELLDRLLSSGGELVTLVLGAAAPAGLDETLRRHVARRWPLVEVQTFPGGRPDVPLLVGVE